jgi:omega-amidase
MSTVNFTIIQSELHWENSSANLAMFSEKLAGIPAETEVVVLPEMFNTGFTMQPALYAQTMDGEVIQWLKKESKQLNKIICGSTPIVENGKYYNRFVWMQPNGEYLTYDKKHLFVAAGEHLHYTAGQNKLIVTVNGIKIMPLICFDLRFPIWSRNTLNANGVPDYDVLLYVSNWPEVRSHHFRQLGIARAIENQAYVINVNRVGEDGNENPHNGCTAVIDPLGHVEYECVNKEDMYSFSITKNSIDEVRNQFPFLAEADKFKLLS